MCPRRPIQILRFLPYRALARVYTRKYTGGIAITSMAHSSRFCAIKQQVPIREQLTHDRITPPVIRVRA
jgi:hypothetical protein